MYLVGAPHPRKAEAQILLDRLIAARERLVTDAEALQEIIDLDLDSIAAVRPPLGYGRD